MEIEQIIPGVVGAFVGVVGWLAVGIYIQRLQFRRQSKNAARAVYFELEMNRLSVQTASKFNSFTPLGRASFERLLPELATWLRPRELQAIVAAYMAHAGYEQVRASGSLPEAAKKGALSGIEGSHERALAMLRDAVFSKGERRSLKPTELTLND